MTLSRRLFLTSALAAAAAPTWAAEDASLVPRRFGTFGLDLDGRDTRVRPGDDFNAYANGRFLGALQIPPDRTGYGVNYMLSELSERQVHAILEETAAGKGPKGGEVGAEAEKVGAFYRSFMDEARVERLGAAPLLKSIEEIKQLTTREKIAVRMGEVNKGYSGSLFELYIDADPKDPEKYAVSLYQGGLNLPDRDYYLKPAFAEKKAKYLAYVEQMLRLSGWPEPKARAASILALETAIARVSWTRVEQRDPERTYNPMTVAELAKYAPGFPWRTFLDAADLKRVDRVIVNEKTAFPKIAAIFARTPLTTLRAWIAFTQADNAASYLSKPFVDAKFEFRSKTLSGQPEQRPRWKRAVGAVDGTMGEAIGRVYVERHFPPAAKAKIDALVGDLRAAFKVRLEKLDWMSPATKAEAVRKLSQFTVKIAYPDKWRDYSKLVIKADDIYGNIERAQAFEWDRLVSRMNGPVDRLEWGMTPQTANAYYNPTFNEIVFPAAELQPPFFDPDADPAVNYGGIGSVIGHEMTHGFDDEGRKSDGLGRLRDWWTAADARAFEDKAKVLAAQYSTYEPYPGVKINGELTLGENIADLGGLLIALDAYRLSLKGAPAPTVGGLTGDQRFFLAYAQGWRDKRREEAVKQQLVADPHSPEAFRVNGVVRNMDDWYAAFDVKPGEKLYLAPAQRARIW
jgi:putative endopeptidase